MRNWYLLRKNSWGTINVLHLKLKSLLPPHLMPPSEVKQLSQGAYSKKTALKDCLTDRSNWNATSSLTSVNLFPTQSHFALNLFGTKYCFNRYYFVDHFIHYSPIKMAFRKHAIETSKSPWFLRCHLLEADSQLSSNDRCSSLTCLKEFRNEGLQSERERHRSIDWCSRCCSYFPPDLYLIVG